MNIINDIIEKTQFSLKCPYKMEPQFLVIHNTSNDASAKNEASYMKKSPIATSFHFAVDDKEIRQTLPLDRNGWHAGDGEKGNGNRFGIAIEICYSKSGGEKFLKAEDNAASLVAHLLKTYNWGNDKVKKHQDFSNKYCPHRTLDLGWDRFLKKVDANIYAEEFFEKGILSSKDYWSEKFLMDDNLSILAKNILNYIKEKK